MKASLICAALILAASAAQAAPTYNPRDPNTSDRKAASCSYTSQVDRESDRMIRPASSLQAEASRPADRGPIAR